MSEKAFWSKDAFADEVSQKPGLIPQCPNNSAYTARRHERRPIHDAASRFNLRQAPSRKMLRVTGRRFQGAVGRDYKPLVSCESPVEGGKY